MANFHRTEWYMKIPLLTLLLLVMGLSPAAVASWAYSFVVNDGKVFVVSEDRVDESTLGDVVGKVTYHTDQEGTYGGNFSNIYPRGTKYYAVQGIAPELAIAVETQEGYLMARYEGEYSGTHVPWEAIKDWMAAGLILLIVVWVAIVVRKKRASGSYRR
ncbi:hypothetical protein J14TS5_39870 [Paenibacillus lautus]|uniref:hypothetical protein n=1 Tax=Paenibacillus lautus TaxID=1401 RepID=UPI001B1B643F|nr:hypothetical protein [Paenibacillus lautus]GIO98901.1 hypothetical protein J14TS5_39870 [Paenibacillus lautus]